ncbi:TetR/AcrR family transcriptional regulator [Geothrix sp. 21YS21S-2]|uniref:TetR/AcrR family transcriptional regulator n=1 Tax=Geothrix sp. 21YS21S-2 TaxID=3068893 RepID=UPI0027B9ED70|nr:TetR/AcrR family transcriptional regulator [Geothrix sp. 21YS21S-2]
MDAVLTAAAQVFEERGYAEGTTNRIAEAAGVSIGTLYQYFPSKEALAVALLERHIEETRRRMREWVGHMLAENHTLHASLEDYVSGMLDVHVRRPRLQHILLEETPLPEHVHRLLLESEHQYARTLAGLLRTYPDVRHPALEHAAYVVIHTVEALTHRFAAHPEDPAIDQSSLSAELVAMLEAYLSARSLRQAPG